MNKLTEIKERLDYAQNCIGLEGISAREDLKIHAESDIVYLISLLEEKNKEIQEKDKALAFYAEYDNHKWKVEAGDYFMKNYTNVTQDYGNIARKALNTSSNQEGETI